MRYRGTNISLETYKEVREKIYKVIWDVCDFNGMDISDLTSSDVQEYFEKNSNYEYIPYEFSDKMSLYFMGDLIICEDLITIGYNINKKIPVERQNFTKMHETAHSILHKKHYPIVQKFSEITELKGYSDKDKYLEIEADLGSSILMINDHALYKCIMDLKSFDYICKKFAISKIALHLRIKNFLEYNCKLNFSTAETFSTFYMNDVSHMRDLLVHLQCNIII